MRLLSYNIHKGIGGWDLRYRLERVVAVIAEAAADLICLQEVTHELPRTRRDDQAALLRERLGLEAFRYQVNHCWRRGGYGNLLLSRWPIAAAWEVSLRYRGRKIRGAQLAVIETPEGPLHLVHWHLGLAERERHWQVGHLLDHAHFAASAHLPTLVVGDFNDWRDTLAGGPFARHGFTQVTHPAKRFRSFPAFPPMLALDKAFVRGPVLVRDARIVRTRAARWASDHLPLLLDFHLAAS